MMPFTYDDATEDGHLRIERNSVGVTVSTSDAVVVPLHDLAKVAAALYQIAGQPVPDLPVIHDPAMVQALAVDIAKVFDVHQSYPENARKLLDAGWRKP